MNKFRVKRFVAAASALAVAPAVTFAQTTGEAKPETISEIVVTGSRIVRDGSDAPTPVTAVTADSLVAVAPSNIPDALNKLPQFSGSTNQNSGRTFNAGSAPLGNYLNLRGIGPQRVLVLLNGQRVPPTLNTNAVDTNLLPQQLISRVEVVTGGVSAVYGSDAVSGVVNFIFDEKYEGLKVSAQGGISDESDAVSQRYGLAFGKALGDRVHFLASAEHYDNDGVPSLFDRDWAPHTGAPVGAGTVASPITVYPDTTRNTLSDGGLVVAGPLAAGTTRGVTFQPDGTLVPFDFGTPTIASNTSVGGGGGIWGEPRNGGTSITGTLDTDQAFARMSFDVTPSLQMFAQGTYANSQTGFNSTPNNSVVGAAGGGRMITIFADNPYLRPEVAALLGTTPSFSVGRIFSDIPVVTQQTENEYVSGQFGLKGEIGDDWSWDANYVYGRSQLDAAFNEFDSRNFFAAIDAVRDPATGNIVCGVTLRNPSLLPGCAPMNVMGDGNISSAAFAFTRRDSKYRIVNEMNYANLNLQGGLFELPAGSVRIAGGVEYREQELEQTSNSNPAIWSDPTTGPAARAAYFNGIRGVPASTLLFNSINVGIGSGKQEVTEGYGELVIPLLKDVTAAQNLSLDLAARYTDYKTSGSVTTWKVGTNWIPVQGLRFRASKSRDIAAPSLYDLFAGENLVVGQILDPLTGLNQTVPTSSSGNAELKPEFADTITLGVVLQPVALSGLTVSIDVYRIEIADAIGTQSATQMLADCHASGGTAPVCGLIERPFDYSNSTPANYPTKIRVIPQNLAELKTQGVDFEISYTFPAFGGDLDLRAFANYLDAYDTQAAASQPVIHRVGRSNADVDGFGLTKWKGLLSQTYANDSFSLSLAERFTGKYLFGSPTQVFATPIEAPNKVYVDLNATYNFGRDKNMQAFFNVQNVLDQDPPNMNTALITNLSVSTDKQLYDVVGRYFTAGVRIQF